MGLPRCCKDNNAQTLIPEYQASSHGIFWNSTDLRKARASIWISPPHEVLFHSKAKDAPGVILAIQVAVENIPLLAGLLFVEQLKVDTIIVCLFPRRRPQIEDKGTSFIGTKFSYLHIPSYLHRSSVNGEYYCHSRKRHDHGRRHRA